MAPGLVGRGGGGGHPPGRRLIALAGGLGAAICFAVSTLGSARSSRLIGAPPVVAWMMLVGLLVTIPLFPVTGALDVAVSSTEWALLVLGGVTYLSGLTLEYLALRVGRVGLVVGLVSAEGAVAAAISIIGGQPVTLAAGAALAVIAGGVVVIGLATDDRGSTSADPRVAILLAMGSAGCFGVNLVVIGRLGLELPLPWALVAPRVMGVVGITLPLLVTRRLRLTRAAAPFVFLSGICEVAGLASFVAGARGDLAVSSVLVSQFATICAVAAWFLFRERLTAWQVAGVTVVIAGVAALAVIQA